MTTTKEAMTTTKIDDHWIETGRGRIFARRWQPAGQAAMARAPLVLFHESLGCVDVWRGFPQALAEATGRTVIAYDRLGFGRSDPREDAPVPVAFIAEEARTGFRALKEALNLERFIGFGHSVGGPMAVCCAGLYPEACVGVITVAAVVKVESWTWEGLVRARQLFAEQAQFQRLLKYHGDKSRWVLDAWLDTWLSDEMKRWSLADDLARVRCPLLTMQGARDEFSTNDQPRFIASHAGGEATVCMIEDCGHVPHHEKTDDVLQACASWLSLQQIP